MAKIRRKGQKRRLLIMIAVVVLFAYYIAVGVVVSYMNISVLPKIIALTLPSFFMGVAVTLLALDIRYGTHLRRHRKTKESGENDVSDDR